MPVQLIDVLNFAATRSVDMRAKGHIECAERDEQMILDTTACLDSHPTNPDGSPFDGMCHCAECLSYAD